MLGQTDKTMHVLPMYNLCFPIEAKTTKIRLLYTSISPFCPNALHMSHFAVAVVVAMVLKELCLGRVILT